MRILTLAGMALIGASFAATSASAMPVNSGVKNFASESQVIQIGDWKGKHSGKKNYWKHRRGHRDRDRNFSFGFGIPLALGLGYGLSNGYYNNDDVDCIGRWHGHNSGRLHCHGQLVWD